MIMSFDDFCSRYVDFVGSWVEFVVGNTVYDEFLIDFETTEKLIDKYSEMCCDEVLISFSE